MMTPNFEDPMDTAKQLVDNNIILYDIPRGQIWKQFLEQSPIPEYNKLAETYYVTKDWDEFDYYSEHKVIGSGTHAHMGSYLDYELDMGRWYRSKERVSGKYPWTGYLSNKKWYLNDVRKVYKLKLYFVTFNFRNSQFIYNNFNR